MQRLTKHFTYDIPKALQETLGTEDTSRGYIELAKCECELCKEVCEAQEDSCKDCPINEAIYKLAEYEDLEESVFNMFNDQITVKEIINAFVAYHELHQQGTEVAECVLLVNDEVRKYREWKQAAEQKGE